MHIDEINSKIQGLQDQISNLYKQFEILTKKYPENNSYDTKNYLAYRNYTNIKNNIYDGILEMLKQKEIWLTIDQLVNAIEKLFPDYIPTHIIHHNSYIRRAVIRLVYLGKIKEYKIPSFFKVYGLPDWNEDDIIPQMNYAKL